MQARFPVLFVACFAILSTMLLRTATAALATPPATQPSPDLASDPRPALAAYFDAIRKGDEAAAYDCWFDDIRGNQQQYVYVDDLIHHLIRQMIASAKFEAALRAMLPDAFQKLQQAAKTTPDTPQLLACKFTVYHRLAICNWGSDDDDGLPMVLDNLGITQGLPAVWKLSMQLWSETNTSSVGNSMLLSGWDAKAMDLTTKEILDGEFDNLQQVQRAYMNHMKAIAKAETKAATTRPHH